MAVFIDLRPQLKHIRLLYIFIGILVCTASFKGCHSGKLGEFNGHRTVPVDINNRYKKATSNGMDCYVTGTVPGQLKISDVLRNIVGKQLNVRATYDTLMRNEWIIAAPVDTMTNNTTIELYSEYSEMKKRIIEDPIIFKASKIGAVIVTMWDKEAEDSMFDKYR